MFDFKYVLICAAAGLLAAQPCLSAEIAGAPALPLSGTYAGAYLDFPLKKGGGGKEARVGLRFGVTQTHLDGRRNGTRRSQANLVDISIVGSGRPSLMVGGWQLFDHRGRLALEEKGNDTGKRIPTWAIIAGGMIVSGGLGYLTVMELLDCDRNEECN